MTNIDDTKAILQFFQYEAFNQKMRRISAYPRAVSAAMPYLPKPTFRIGRSYIPLIKAELGSIVDPDVQIARPSVSWVGTLQNYPRFGSSSIKLPTVPQMKYDMSKLDNVTDITEQSTLQSSCMLAFALGDKPDQTPDILNAAYAYYYFNEYEKKDNGLHANDTGLGNLANEAWYINTFSSYTQITALTYSVSVFIKRGNLTFNGSHPKTYTVEIIPCTFNYLQGDNNSETPPSHIYHLSGHIVITMAPKTCQFVLFNQRFGNGIITDGGFEENIYVIWDADSHTRMHNVYSHRN